MSARGDRDNSIVAALFRLPVAMGAAGMNLFLSPLRAVLAATTPAANANKPNTSGAESVQTGAASENDPVRDTMNGLIAFVVPGPDAYSVAQGMSTTELGGIDAGIRDGMIAAMNLGQPHSPQGPLPSQAATGLLNQVAAQINPSSQGKFISPFARLSYGQKVAVFQFLETDPSMMQFRRLAALLLFLPAAAAYSEGGSFDLAARRVVGWPVGWTISSYPGVSDGWDEFKGYFQGRDKPLHEDEDEDDLEDYD